MDYKEKYDNWCQSPDIDEVTREELLAIRDQDEIRDRFYKDITFGTGGLRGLMGAGTNRINIYTIRKATQGLANYIKLKSKAHSRPSFAIAYDSRHMSKEFALEAGLILAKNNIRVYIYPDLRPTPMLSFAIRQLKCLGGIMITASHNPPAYNGYKVYWQDGGQVTFPIDREIMEKINTIGEYLEIKPMSYEEAVEKELLNYIGEEVDEKYYQTLEGLLLKADIVRNQAKEIRVVYSPLHGTGNIPVRKILSRIGFENIYIVKEQERADGDFPTLASPNPEDDHAFDLAIRLANKVKADLVLATDPDADRLGAYFYDRGNDKYIKFTGNMIGALILEYQLSVKKSQGEISPNDRVFTTIVSGKMPKKIAKAYNVNLIETLTGFKYIGEQISLFEKANKNDFVFAYEESYGFLLGSQTRDKDAIVSAMALCELCAYYNSRSMSVIQQMDLLYRKYGYFKEALFTIELKGEKGEEKTRKIMEAYRQAPPKEIGGYRVIKIRDYYKSREYRLIDKSHKPISLPKSNVIYFELENEAWWCVRPSGTEAKLKYYMGVREDNMAESTRKLQEIEGAIRRGLIGQN